MDLNQLYSDHQVLLVRAAHSATSALRRQHAFGATLIAGRIGCMQRAMGAAAATQWDTLALSDEADFPAQSQGSSVLDPAVRPCPPREASVSSPPRAGSSGL